VHPVGPLAEGLVGGPPPERFTSPAKATSPRQAARPVSRQSSSPLTATARPPADTENGSGPASTTRAAA